MRRFVGACRRADVELELTTSGLFGTRWSACIKVRITKIANVPFGFRHLMTSHRQVIEDKFRTSGPWLHTETCNVQYHDSIIDSARCAYSSTAARHRGSGFSTFGSAAVQLVIMTWMMSLQCPCDKAL
ncbi:hypothetical protein BV25DRAFT_1258212 [Artomyces pyxidatus]|uniref:Uncharacterized protein n=1 Tax=Artomyces pyxidatus TaxID=48021 RepID=A0ACB8TEN2_9AGAM|nr:hypothetical protein BV25DRAFT_1258212 [Artomyces pyxidatus]